MIWLNSLLVNLLEVYLGRDKLLFILDSDDNTFGINLSYQNLKNSHSPNHLKNLKWYCGWDLIA